MKKRLAIISSYNESCGNASYTEVLRREFIKHYNVDILSLQVDILNSTKKKFKKLANEHIRNLASQLKNYDYVNIQCELGLYGATPQAIYKRLKILIKASPNLILTMHRLDIKERLDLLGLRTLLRGGLMKLSIEFRQNRSAAVCKKIIKEIKKKAKKANAHIIVHTKRDEKLIKKLYNFECVHNFPLTFFNQMERSRTQKPNERHNFNDRYSLDSSDIIIGLFGFINAYKGHETVLSALKHLPQNYKVMIFGSQHPMSYEGYTLINKYLKKLVALVETGNLSNRVFFVGNLSDDDFINALYCCDYAVLPYLEVNQGGSGIASIVLESKIKSFYSNNKAFKELAKYFPNCFETFDMGNYLELAYKIMNYKNDFSVQINKCMEEYNLENNVLFYKNLFERRHPNG